MILQIPKKFVNSLNSRLCELMTLSHLDISVIFFDWNTGIFTYYYKDDVESHMIMNIVNAQKRNIEVDENFKFTLNGCANYMKQEFNGVVYEILHNFEYNIKNKVIMAELLVEQSKDIKAGVTIFT